MLLKAFPGVKVLAAALGAHFTRTWSLETVTIVHVVRDRAAHHEPFISGFQLPGQRPRLTAQQAHETSRKLAGLGSVSSLFFLRLPLPHHHLKQHYG
ncbi:hypothetical protein GCM10023166_15770 [Paeniglutamicibacter cryotolerans]|uniref:Uncharacterized protein n=1 Tax=Paeniglutamicibacter cryotolerans TaxID=670079 RepID=A0A839QNV1_9MICC|nr:hypothetical protein [Paeniglutamicibacter cryotolerans]